MATASLVGQTIGNYRVLRLIGAGGMGQVYSAKDPRLNREVAIKIIHPAISANPEALRRFEHEARALAALNHPNLLAIYDIGVYEGSPYIVSELLEGETLRARIDRERIGYHRALEISSQIVRALVAAHEKGIVHRDVKPENIFLTTDGHVKVLDFGLAKLTTPDSLGGNSTVGIDTAQRTEAGRVVGTVAYMSPEQVRGQIVDHRTDIFSFGAILFEMLTQKRPFQGLTSADLITAILKEDPQTLSESNPQIPPAASLVVQHCLEKVREDRFQSARDLLFDLTLLNNRHYSSATTIAATERRHRYFRSVLWGAAAGLLLAACAALVMWFLRTPEDRLSSYTQLTFRRGFISSARFTSDGNMVLYSAYWSGNPVDTYFIRTGTTESRPIGIHNADLISVSINGELAILLRKPNTLAWFEPGTLARVPMTGGTPREVVEDVQSADWSPDGSQLAIARQVQDKQRLEFPIGKSLFETYGWVTDIRFSPKGDQIAFMEHRNLSDDRGWVSVVDLGGHVKRVTEEFASERGLAWSPKGDEIWFTATRSGEAFELFSVSLGGKVRTRTRVPSSLVLHDIAHDGTLLISSAKSVTPIISLPPGQKVEHDLSTLDQTRLIDMTGDGQTYIFQYYGEGSGPSYSSYLGGTDGSPPVRLGAGAAVTLSPDGRWVVTFDDQSRKTLLQPIGAGDVRVLERPDFSETAGDDTWCPDGKCVVFTGQKKGEVARIYIQSVDGTMPVPFGPAGFAKPLISPDGKRFIARKDGAYYLLNMNGGVVNEIHGLESGERVIRWSGDGEKLYVYRVEDSIYLSELDPTSGKRRTLRQIALPDRAGVLGMPRLFVSADAKSYVYSFVRQFAELYLAKGFVQ